MQDTRTISILLVGICWCYHKIQDMDILNLNEIDSLGSLQGVRIRWAETRDTDARPIQSQLGACGAAEEASGTHPGREAWAESRQRRDFLLPWLCQVWRIQHSVDLGILGISELRLHSVQLLQKTILHDAAANVHGNLRVSPPTVTPPENKSLLRNYWGIMVVNNPQ